jgi:hypothetical protein
VFVKRFGRNGGEKSNSSKKKTVVSNVKNGIQVELKVNFAKLQK